MLVVNDLKIPRSWEIIAGADTGTYMSGLIAAISPSYDLYALEEFPNYHYVGDGNIELLGWTVSEWRQRFARSLRRYTGQRRFHAWVDANTTFKTEIGNGLSFKMNKKRLELRTEITREYVRNGRFHVAPWLEVLPYEMEEASFPEQETIGGQFVRIKRKDHTLDCAEHICSRRPNPEFTEQPKETGRHKAIQAHLRQHSRMDRQDRYDDPHLGAN